MRKFLEKLPIEGLLIIFILLLGLIIILLFTKIENVVQDNNKLVVETVTTKDVSFIQKTEPQKVLVPQETVNTNEFTTEELPSSNKEVELFYIKVNVSGEIVLERVRKNIFVGSTPLTKTIEKLLEGPDTGELNRGLLTLIPEDTKLISISIKENTAFLNFNEAFVFNTLGIEGYVNQIKQIVFTATSYPSVTHVQFLIDGSTREYLGLEGVYIGRPISRSDF